LLTAEQETAAEVEKKVKAGDGFVGMMNKRIIALSEGGISKGTIALQNTVSVEHIALPEQNNIPPRHVEPSSGESSLQVFSLSAVICCGSHFNSKI